MASFVARRSWRWRPTTARRSSVDTTAGGGNQRRRPRRLARPGDADEHHEARIGQAHGHGLTVAPRRAPDARPAHCAHPSSMIGAMIFTTRCAGCDAPGAPICRTCRFALVSRADPAGPTACSSPLPFSGRVRDVLLGFKYRNRRAIAGHLAGLLVNRLAAAGPASSTS